MVERRKKKSRGGGPCGGRKLHKVGNTINVGSFFTAILGPSGRCDFGASALPAALAQLTNLKTKFLPEVEGGTDGNLRKKKEKN